MTKLTANVVGGGAGGRLSMTALTRSDRYELIAACDLREEVCEELEELYPNIRTFTSHREMFTECPTEIVCVSTWAPSHKEITLDALRMLELKGILVEKPLAGTAAAGGELVEAIRSRRLPMCVPHGLLVARHAGEIIDRVQRGKIGELKLLEIQCDKWDIINAGIHWLNFFVVLTGNEELDYVMAQCDASTRTFRDGMQVETIAVTYAQTRSGVRVVMTTGDEVLINREGKQMLFRLVGTGGQIEFWAWESAYRLQNGEFPEGKLFAPEPHAKSGHQLHLENMVEQIESGRPDYAIPESSLMALELVEGAYLSSAHGCRVNLPLDTFALPEPNDWRPGQPYSGSGGGRDGRKLQ